MRFHGHYRKYHWAVLILILRVRCRVCLVTHALIPSFSVPQSSHDTDSVEVYLKARAAGMTRRQSGAEVLAQGYEVRVLKRLERSFARCCRNWSALFGVRLSPSAGIDAFAAHNSIDPEGPVLGTANLQALGRRVNAVFASRASILLFVNRRTGERIPHNLVSPGSSRAPPHSW